RRLRRAIGRDVAVHEEAWRQLRDQAVEGDEPAVGEVVLLGPESLWRCVRQQHIEAAAAPSPPQARHHLDAQRPPAHLGLRVLVWTRPVPHRTAQAGDAEPGGLLDLGVDVDAALWALPQ